MCGLKWYTDGKCDHTGLPSDGSKVSAENDVFLKGGFFPQPRPGCTQQGVGQCPRNAFFPPSSVASRDR